MVFVYKCSLILIFVFPMLLFGQDPTVGLIEYTDEVSDGYILFTPLSSESTYLIDNCGKKINEWDGLEPSNSNLALLSPDGSLVRSSFNSFYQLNWENELMWSFDVATLDLIRHHDFHIMPNGNILFIASKVYSYQEMIDKGRNPNGINGGGGGGGFKVDGIYEIKPTGIDEAELVWSWNFYDHLVQNYTTAAENYDQISNQPRRLDVNFNGEEGNAFDWLHCNGIDYHPALDQIIISSRSTCEFYIIDHSTTIEEAADTTGGIYGFGGDFLWRWGNQVAYGMGTNNDQKFWEQHDPKWIKNGYPNEGMITVYNNLYNYDFDGVQPFSNVHLIDPNAQDGVYSIIDSSNTFAPTDFHFTYSGEVVGNNMWSNIMSNVESMSNGNLFVCQGTTGEMFEVNPDKEIVWVYQNPVREFIYNQGSNPLSLSSAVDIFITTKYTADFDGFQNYDMMPQDILEDENNISAVCNWTVGVETFNNADFSIYPNPVDDVLMIESVNAKYSILLTDIFGKVLLEKNGSFNATLDLSGFDTGVYFLSFRKMETSSDYKTRHTIKVIVK